MADPKNTPAKDKALESDVLKAAGVADGAVNQGEIKDAVTQGTGSQVTNEPAKAATEAAATGPGPDAVNHYQQQPGSVTASFPKDGIPLPGYPNEPHATDAELEEFRAFRAEKAKRAEEAEQRHRQAVLDAGSQSEKHAEYLKTYGPGYVVAKKGNDQVVFTATTWKHLGGNTNREGWRQVVTTPPEVQKLQSGQ